MDRSAVQALLDAENVDPAAYSLEGGTPRETHVLERRSFERAVYYSERGLRSGEVVFPTEDDACSHVLDLMLRDNTTRRRR